jgi:hypothetical protein
MLEEPIKEGVPPKMKGSVLMCVADTEEEVLERVKRDVYYTGNVWDKEKVSETKKSEDWASWGRKVMLGLDGRNNGWVEARGEIHTDWLNRFKSFLLRVLLGRHLTSEGEIIYL